MAVTNVEPPKDKKFRKSISLNIDFQDLGNDIFRSTVSIKTFDLKDQIKELGYVFEGKNSDSIRDGKVQKEFTQKKEVYIPKDLALLRKVTLTEILEILREFEKTLVLNSSTSANSGGNKQTPTA
jgi:ABC-type oligopeptide transport system substrate-binding subunit